MTDQADAPILTNEIQSAISAIMLRRGYTPDDYNLERLTPSPSELEKASIRREYRELREGKVKSTAAVQILSEIYHYTTTTIQTYIYRH